MYIWSFIKRSSTEVQPLVAVLGGIASVLIAFFAYQIDLKVQANALRTAQIDRANAMISGIYNDVSFRQLRTRTNRIEALVSKQTNMIREERAETRAQEIARLRQAGWDRKAGEALVLRLNNEERSRDYINKFHTVSARITGRWLDRATFDRVYVYIDHVLRAKKCLEPVNPGASDVSAHAICDRNTIYSMVGPTFFNAYTFLRPALFCRPEFRPNARDIGAFLKEYDAHINGGQNRYPDSFFTGVPDVTCPEFDALFDLDRNRPAENQGSGMVSVEQLIGALSRLNANQEEAGSGFVAAKR